MRLSASKAGKTRHLLLLAGLSFIVCLVSSASSFAACGANNRTWNGGGPGRWNNAGSWTIADIPNTSTENAVVVSASKVCDVNQSVTYSCLDVQSGSFSATTNAITHTITGDYARALLAGTFNVGAGVTFTLTMGGTAAQTVEIVDPINYLTISNTTTVTISQPTTIRNSLNITGAGATLKIGANVTLSDTTTPFNVPAGRTVEVNSGATLTALGGITVAGTLKINPGGKVVIGNGMNLTVNAGGLLQLAGASGNVATLDGNGGSFNLSVAGSVNANYFRINRPTAAGMNVTGTIQQLSNGEFHYLANAGVAVTLGSAAVIPSTMNYLGFFDDSSFGNVRNFNASAYNLTSTTLNNWSGLGGDANESSDPNGRIIWGSADSTRLTVSNNTAAGSPPATILPSAGPTYFATFAFALTQADVYTDITSVKLTQYGTATSSDLDYIQVYKDAAGGTTCVYDAGVDTQVGSNVTMLGSPPVATVSIPTADVRTSGTAPACFHVLARTSATAQGDNTIGFKIGATGDVTNVKSDATSYAFSDSSGPPVSAASSTITSTSSTWNGSQNTTWTTANNWTPKTVPSSTQDCVIASGVNVPALGANRACRNVTLPSGGTLNFGNAAYQLQSYGSLTGSSTFTFQNAALGELRMMGSSNQSLSLNTTFPGNLVIANTGGATVSVDGDTTITGNVTVTQGTLSIASGKVLTVNGNLTVQTGAVLEVAPGGTLKMGNSRTLTVDAGGTLKLIGTSSDAATVSLASGVSGYSVVVNGTIQAQYYTFEKMGLSGVSIASTATIDNTYHLQNGSFTYPMVNNTVMLMLNRQVPTNTMDNMVFDASGSAATGVTNISTNAAAGTLAITTYSGTWAGPTYDNDPTYLISWTGATNTLDLTQGAVGPASVNQGMTYNMGRFAFKQTQAGVSFSNTSITSLKLTLTGTATASDITQARIYYDADCDSAAGTLLGSGTFSGSPATLNFTGLVGATVEASSTTPPTRCIYVEYDISASAVNANTVGASIAASADVVNSQNYAISAGTPPPVTLGTPATIIGSTTTWTGATSTDWCVAGNWNGGVPTPTLNCDIPNVANDPVISGTCAGVVPRCKNVNITTGILTMNAGTMLDVYGNFTSTGTFNQNTGSLRLRDNGSAITQTITTPTNGIGALTFSKSAGGSASISGNAATIGSFSIPAGSTFEWIVPTNQTLTLTTGATISSATFTVQSAATLAIPNGQSITVSGGTFKTTGVNDVYPQSTTNKARVTVSGAGRWNFTATSGAVDLTGFIFDYIGTNGLNVGGTTALTNLNGGQFTNLSTSYASVKAIQLNTTGTIPATATNIGWNWGAANGTYNNPPSPGTTDAYLLASSTGCGNQSISFDQWFGDFFQGVNNPVTSTKVSATNCTITIAASSSPVSLTSFTATGYDGEVAVQWQTGSEIDHQGFNVFRSTNPSSGYIQVNPTMIRNFNTSSSARGVYRYLDQDVVNGTTYYYRLEDISITGARVVHGPAAATPDFGLGAAPGAAASTNTGSSMPGAGIGNAPTAGAIATPDIIDLGNGVHILAQTQNSLRLEIVPPAATINVSAWDGSYRTISLPGYSSTTEAGKPELVERTVLVEVDDSHTTATLGGASVTEEAPTLTPIAPAPSWALNGSGVLQPSWSIDAAAYSVNSYAPASYYSLDTALVSVGEKKYVRVHVKPFVYNAVTTSLKKASRIVLDIGLSGAAWNASVPSASAAISPSLVEGALRIKYSQSGIYEVSYNDLQAAGLEGFFHGADTADFRMYVQGREVPLQVFSSNGSFYSGDSVRFYLPYTRTVEDTLNEAVLSVFALGNSAGAPLRMQTIDGDPSLVAASGEIGTQASALAEQDLMFISDTPFASEADHFYWRRIYAQAGASLAPAYTKAVIALTMPNLIRTAPQPVRLKLHLRGRASMTLNPVNHVGIYVNTIPFMLADATFSQVGPVTLTFSIPSSFFVPGVNNVRVQVLADGIPNGDWEIIDIDRLEAEYRADRVATADTADVYVYARDRKLSVSGFTASTISAYDVSDRENVMSVSNVQVTGGAGNFAATFNASSGLGQSGFHFMLIEDSAVLKPVALTLGRGADLVLQSTTNGADLIVVGARDLIDAAEDLIDQRRAEGMRVIAAPLDQVYAEFSHGVVSSQAIRDFIRYAQANWRSPAPRYLLVIGDATYDPRDRFGYGTRSGVMPIPIERGSYADFGNDNWFVAPGGAGATPTMAVGRIPSSNPREVEQYVAKLLDYEDGSRAPNATFGKELVFVSDADTNSEGFNAGVISLAQAAASIQPAFATPTLDRPTLGSDAATKTAILDAFNDGPLAITYLGHGAEDMWADAAVFTGADAGTLSNTRLPIGIGLNCLNSYFYDPDATYLGLGEQLVMNPDGGAVAFWGSTTLTTPMAQLALARAFFNELAQETRSAAHVVRIGDLAMRAKAAVGSGASMLDAVRSYTLIGDPTAKLPNTAFSPVASGGGGGGTGGAAKADEEAKKFGLVGCGTIRSGSDDGTPPSTNGFIEFALLAAFLTIARLVIRGRPDLSSIRSWF